MHTLVDASFKIAMWKRRFECAPECESALSDAQGGNFPSSAT
jgi:hypothetical protein